MPFKDQLLFGSDYEYEIELIFDTCKEGLNKKGEPWYLYTIKYEGEEYGHFASPDLHEKLKRYSRGDILKITNTPAGFKVVSGKDQESAPKNNEENKHNGPNWDKINSDKTKDIHRQVCLKLAVQSIGTSTESMPEQIYDEIRKRMGRFISILDPEPDNLPF